MQLFKFDRRHFAVGFIAWAGLIFWSASQPGSGQPQAFEGLDKIQHFFAYGVLAFLLAKSTYRRLAWNSLVVIVMTTILLGVCDELYQATIPNRSSSIADVIADGIGAIMGFLSAWIWQVYHDKKRKE